MNWLQFISDMVGHLAWPIVVLIIVFAIRKHLGSLAERVLELSFGGATVKFDKLLSKGAELIERAELPSQVASPDERRRVTERISKALERIKELRSRPVDVGQILNCYESIEKLIREIGEAVGRPSNSTIVIMSFLLKKDLVSPEFARLFGTLREGRNIVAHGYALSDHEIVEYIRQASFFEANLSLLLDQIRSGERKVPT
jgi:uncharacterized protein YutE (UPF0331/DUF86 family)